MILGLLLCVLSGLCWVAVGVAVGSVERHGWPIHFFQVLNSLFSCVVCAAALALGGWLSPESGEFRFTGARIPAISLFVCGLLNYLMVWAMAVGMHRGPNGLVWTITQSGLVFPFLMGVFVLGNTTLTWARGLGILLILANIAASGFGKKRGNTASGQPLAAWFPAALAAFVFCGANQCAANLPSYLATSETSTLERTLWCMSGGLVAWVLHHGVRALAPSRKADGGTGEEPARPARSVGFLVLAAAGVTFTGVTSAVVFQFRGLDLLAAANAGAVGYPLMVATCLIGFFLYSALVLRERQSRLQYAGLAACVAGAALLCV